MKMPSSLLLSGLALALPFVATYWLVRSLPVEPCDFLHEETYNLQGELDYCGPGDAGFVDLSVRRWPMTLEFRPLDPLVAGLPCRFEVEIRQADGSPLTADDVALSHTKKIHLLAIDQTLEDYQHLHPQADPLFNGVWHFSLTPRLSGKYEVFLDLIPLRSPRRVLLNASFEVAPATDDLPPSPLVQTDFKGRVFRLERVSDQSSDAEVMLKFTASDQSGNDLPLRPVMGAFAHLVAFEPALRGFAHLHPVEYEPPQAAESTRSGPLSFLFKSPRSGAYRLWAQVLVGDDESESFLPFDLEI